MADYAKFVEGVKQSKVETPAKKKADVLLARRERKKQLVGQIKRTLRELRYGGKTYLKRKPREQQATEKAPTAWKTAQEMSEREKLGAELKRLRRKGKK